MAKAQRALAAAGTMRPADVEPYSHESTAAAVARLTALVEAQERVIRQYETGIAHSRRIFDEASAAARLGIWECELPSNTLQWSNGTYDLFDLPRGSPVTRQQTLKFYPPESLEVLQAVRSRAIEERRAFDLDAEIVTPKGRRWIRINATVECSGDRPTRLFGIKRDITEERALLVRTRFRADFDEMTGLANRGQFDARLADACGDDSGRHDTGALLLIDLDGFKQVNDSMGHMAGDACLREVAQRISHVGREASLVARVGGDEFAVLLLTPRLADATELAVRIVEAMSVPVDYAGRRFQIGASIGIAAIDGCPSRDLYGRADTALYAAKAAGRGTYRIFHPARMRG